MHTDKYQPFLPVLLRLHDVITNYYTKLRQNFSKFQMG
jgi:hypothetical protein